MWKVNGPGSCWYIRLMWWIIGLHFGFRGPAEPTRDRKWAIMRAEWKLIICKIWNSLGHLTLWSLILKFNSFRIIFFFKILIQQWVRVRWGEFFFFFFWGSLSVIVGVKRLDGSYEDGLNLQKCLFRGKGWLYISI